MHSPEPFITDKLLKVQMELGVSVKIQDTPEAVEYAKETVVRHLNNYFYRDIQDQLIDLTREIQEGKERQATVESLYKIMEDLI